MPAPSRRHFIKIAGLTGLSLPLHGLALGAPKKEEDEPVSIPVIKPTRLQPGDQVAISSPAGAVWKEELVTEFTEVLTGLGLRVVTGRTLTQKYGYLAGTDEMRATELNEFFADKNTKAILSAKGGWGCARLLDKLNYSLIRENPKIMMGFSDITCLLNAIYAKTGLVTFHGPVGNSSWGEFSMKYVKSVLMQAEKTVFVPYDNVKDAPVVITPGKARGRLTGGNMAVLTGMMGSVYLPAWENKILFLEETAEEPYRLDRMITQLKLNGVLDKISGFVFGKCVKCEAEEPEKAFTFREVLEQHIKPLGIPAFYGAMIGHIENKYTLPIGIEAEMDADKGTITLLESAVI